MPSKVTQEQLKNTLKSMILGISAGVIQIWAVFYIWNAIGFTAPITVPEAIGIVIFKEVLFPSAIMDILFERGLGPDEQRVDSFRKSVFIIISCLMNMLLAWWIVVK